jgi:hypothetical protein
MDLALALYDPSSYYRSIYALVYKVFSSPQVPRPNSVDLMTRRTLEGAATKDAHV